VFVQVSDSINKGGSTKLRIGEEHTSPLSKGKLLMQPMRTNFNQNVKISKQRAVYENESLKGTHSNILTPIISKDNINLSSIHSGDTSNRWKSGAGLIGEVDDSSGFGMTDNTWQ
jgi:hypothetical protein